MNQDFASTLDDHRVVRSGVSAYLEQVDDIEVIGEAGDGRQALERMAVLEPDGNLPDVVLVDLLMPVMDGIDATRHIRSAGRIEVVAMTSFVEEAKVRGALEAGQAAGYLLKDADADQVAQAIRGAVAGQMHLDPIVARLLADSLRAPRRPGESLTPREREVLAGGRRRLEPADRADPGGERAHRAHSRVGHPGQAGPGPRTQAALWAVREGLAPNPEAVPEERPGHFVAAVADVLGQGRHFRRCHRPEPG